MSWVDRGLFGCTDMCICCTTFLVQDNSNPIFWVIETPHSGYKQEYCYSTWLGTILNKINNLKYVNFVCIISLLINNVYMVPHKTEPVLEASYYIVCSLQSICRLPLNRKATAEWHNNASLQGEPFALIMSLVNDQLTD